MTDQELGELSFTRTFDAPRELVFRCLIEPEHLTHFWGPAGTSAPLAQIKADPRPGGVFETVMVNDADGSEYPTVTLTLSDLGDGRTHVRIHQARVPAEFRTPQAQAGFLTSLDRFAGYLAGLPPQR